MGSNQGRPPAVVAALSAKMNLALSLRESKVLDFLIVKADYRTGESYYPRREFVQATGIDERHLRRTLTTLEEKQLISRRYARQGETIGHAQHAVRSVTCVYAVLLPPWRGVDICRSGPKEPDPGQKSPTRVGLIRPPPHLMDLHIGSRPSPPVTVDSRLPRAGVHARPADRATLRAADAPDGAPPLQGHLTSERPTDLQPTTAGSESRQGFEREA